MADRVILPQAIDSNGDVVAGAAAYFYESGTTTPLVVYTSAAADTPLGVSVSAGSDGAFTAVYATESVRVDIKDPDGVSLPGFPSDGWYVVPAAGVAANTITFSPIEGNTATNVQTGIANLTTLWNAVTTFGKSLIAAENVAEARATLGIENTGQVAAFARTTAPTGWLECDGAAVSRTTYATLFAAIGTTFGTGDGSTTFNVPDLRGEFVRGFDNGRGVDASRAFGSAQADELKSHTHGGVPLAVSNTDRGIGNSSNFSLDDPPDSTDATGGSETRPRNIALLYCIKT